MRHTVQVDDSTTGSNDFDDCVEGVSRYVDRTQLMRAEVLQDEINEIAIAFDREIDKTLRRLREQNIDVSLKEFESYTLAYLENESLGILRRLRAATLEGPAEWTASAIAGGIIGNLSYDLLKWAWRRIFDAERAQPTGITAVGSSNPGFARQEALTDELAKVAILEQCVRHELPTPDYSQLRIDSRLISSQGAIFRVSCPDPQISAKVVVPVDFEASKTVQVTLHHAYVGWVKPLEDHRNIQRRLAHLMHAMQELRQLESRGDLTGVDLTALTATVSKLETGSLDDLDQLLELIKQIKEK